MFVVLGECNRSPAPVGNGRTVGYPPPFRRAPGQDKFYASSVHRFSNPRDQQAGPLSFIHTGRTDEAGRAERISSLESSQYRLRCIMILWPWPHSRPGALAAALLFLRLFVPHSFVP